MIEAILYGSRARGTHREDSDADIAVIFKGEHGERDDRSRASHEMSGISFDVMMETGVLIQGRASLGGRAKAARTVQQSCPDPQHPARRVAAVNGPTTPPAYMGKAQRALSAARLLLTASETEGACNRAYYAMFYAAHAALIAVRINPPETGYKTHSGLIGAFGQHVIVGAGMDAELGRSINRVPA